MVQCGNVLARGRKKGTTPTDTHARPLSNTSFLLFTPHTCSPSPPVSLCSRNDNKDYDCRYDVNAILLRHNEEQNLEQKFNVFYEMIGAGKRSLTSSIFLDKATWASWWLKSISSCSSVHLTFSARSIPILEETYKLIQNLSVFCFSSCLFNILIHDIQLFNSLYNCFGLVQFVLNSTICNKFCSL